MSYLLFHPNFIRVNICIRVTASGMASHMRLGGEFLSIFDVDNPRLGIRLREASGSHSVIRLPRNESLRILPQTGMMKFFMHWLLARRCRGNRWREESQGGLLEMTTLEAHRCTVALVSKHRGLVV